MKKRLLRFSQEEPVTLLRTIQELLKMNSMMPEEELMIKLEWELFE